MDSLQNYSKSFETQESPSIVRDCILEGELLVFNQENEEIEPFGGVSDFLDRSNCFKRNSVGNRHLFVVFFDLLALNGQSYLNYPLSKRRNILESTVFPIENYVHAS